MTLCKNCGLVLIPTGNEIECPGCGEEVCFICGCTEARACSRKEGNETLCCSWQQPGICNFCFWRIAAQEYAAKVSELYCTV